MTAATLAGSAGLRDRRLPSTIFLFLGFFIAQAALAGTPDSTRSPEEEFIFSEQEIVTAATLAPKPAALAPASVTVVTAEEIRRFGYRMLSDLLANTAGFFVASDRNSDRVGARGFLRPGDLNNRVLILVDGHPMSDEWGGTSAIGTDLGVDLLRAERVEIVRGPGSALYGSNALFGVVNIVTSRGAFRAGAGPWTQAESAPDAADAPPESRTFARAGIAGEGGTAEWGAVHAELEHAGRAFGTLLLTGSMLSTAGERVISLPPPIGAAQGFEVRDVDGTHSRDASLLYQRGALQIDGLYSTWRKTMPVGNLGSAPGDRLANNTNDRGFVRGRLGFHLLGVDGDASLSHDLYQYEARLPQMTGAVPDPRDPPVLVAGGQDRWTTAGLTLRAAAPGSQEITVGAGHRWHRIEGELCGTDRTGVELWQQPVAHDRYDLWSVFAQDIVPVVSTLSVTAGGRYDHYPFFGGELTGRAALIWSADPRTTVKAILGSAFRAPTASEIYVNDFAAGELPIPELEPEDLTTAEIAAERDFGPRLRVRGSVFRVKIENVIDLLPVAPDVNLYMNRQAATSTGGEVEARWTSASGTLVHGYATYHEVMDRDTDSRLASTPEFTAGAGASIPLVRESLFLSVRVQGMGERLTMSGSEAAAYATADMTLLYRSARLPLEMSVRAQNLFDTDYSEPGSPFLMIDSVPQPGRFVAARIAYAF